MKITNAEMKARDCKCCTYFKKAWECTLPRCILESGSRRETYRGWSAGEHAKSRCAAV